MVHFLKLLIGKNEPDHESGALFEAFTQQNEPDHESGALFEAFNQKKRAGPREWCTF